jgi:hypothetical protein
VRLVAGRILQIGHDPLYVELPKGMRPSFDPPPAPAKVLTGHPGKVVMQATLPQADTVLSESAYRMPAGREMNVPVFLYNFGGKAVRGKLKTDVPAGWTAELPNRAEIAPGGRLELALHLTHPDVAGITNAVLRITGKFSGDGGRPVLAFRLTSTRP